MEAKNSLLSSALKTGLILGVVSIVMFILMYVADIKPVGIMMPIVIMLISLAISIIIIVVFLKKFKTSLGGFISFRDAFLFSFIAFAVSAIIYQLFAYLFILVVDPEYYKNIMEAQKLWMENYLAGKMPDDKIAESLDKIDEEAAKMGSVSQVLKGTLSSIIVGAIISLIVGAIMKKKPEMFDNNAGGVI